MKLSPRTIITLVLVSLSTLAFAQSSDVLSWNKLKLGYEPSKNWDFGLEAQLRLKDNFGLVDEYFGEFQIDRRIVKGLKFGVGLRYLFENDTRGNIQGYENHFRYQFDLKYKHDVGRFDLGYRLRYQNKNELGVDDVARQFLRLKGSAEYKIKNWKLDPELAFEVWSKLNVGDEETDKYRITLGSEYDLKNAGEIGFYYRYQSGFRAEGRETRHIIGLSYEYTIK